MKRQQWNSQCRVIVLNDLSCLSIFKSTVYIFVPYSHRGRLYCWLISASKLYKKYVFISFVQIIHITCTYKNFIYKATTETTSKVLNSQVDCWGKKNKAFFSMPSINIFILIVKYQFLLKNYRIHTQWNKQYKLFKNGNEIKCKLHNTKINPIQQVHIAPWKYH